MIQRQQLLNLLTSDGIQEARQLHYIALFSKIENESFINGRRFEIDGKGSPLPGLRGSISPVCVSPEVQWKRDYMKEEEDRMEDYTL